MSRPAILLKVWVVPKSGLGRPKVSGVVPKSGLGRPKISGVVPKSGLGRPKVSGVGPKYQGPFQNQVWDVPKYQRTWNVSFIEKGTFQNFIRGRSKSIRGCSKSSKRDVPKFGTSQNFRTPSLIHISLPTRGYPKTYAVLSL